MELFERIREWYRNNEELVFRKGSIVMAMVMAVVGLVYMVSVILDMGWL